jgi:hypothetical protein
MLGERLGPHEYASLLNRFYRTATETLIRHDAIIDKLIGDEVMALFIPGICGPKFRQRAVNGALALLEAVGYAGTNEPLVPIGGRSTPASRTSAMWARKEWRTSPRWATRSGAARAPRD